MDCLSKGNELHLLMFYNLIIHLKISNSTWSGIKTYMILNAANELNYMKIKGWHLITNLSIAVVPSAIVFELIVISPEFRLKTFV